MINAIRFGLLWFKAKLRPSRYRLVRGADYVPIKIIDLKTGEEVTGNVYDVVFMCGMVVIGLLLALAMIARLM